MAILGLALIPTLNGCLNKHNKGGRVVVFVIDSLSGMMPEERQRFSFFEDFTHGEVVRSIVKQYGNPDKLYFDTVDNSDGSINRDFYIRTLLNIDGYVTRHPKDRVVVNISFGSYSYDSQEEKLIDSLINKGVIIVAAAGNEGMERVCYPAGYEKVIAVGASDRSKIASYSNYGKEIDIVASGIYRSYEQIAIPSDIGYETHTRQVVLKGTSFAAPVVAGTIARMLHFAKDRKIDAEAILKQTAKPIDSHLYHQRKLGSGLLYRHKALSAVEPAYWVYSFIDWSGQFLLAWGVGFVSIMTSLIAYYSVKYSGHKRLKRAAINMGLVPGIFAGVLIFSDLVFYLDIIDYSNLPDFIERYTYNILGCMILAAGVLGVTAVTGTIIGKSIAYLYTLLKIYYSKKAEDISRLKYEMELCYTISGIQKRILRSICACGKKAISYLVRWLTEDRMPTLDREMVEILREFNRRYSLTGHLIQVASYRSKRERVIEGLGIIANKEDGKALGFLHSLEDDECVGHEAKRALERISCEK